MAASSSTRTDPSPAHGSGEPDAADGDARGHAHGREAEAPHEIPARGWKDVLTRVRLEAKADQVPLLSAGVAFYALLSLVPALIAAVALYGLFSDSDDVQRQVQDLAGGLPSSAQELLVDQLESVTESSGAGLSVAAIVAIAIALWSASAGVRQLVAALNLTYDEEESRGFVKLRLQGLALTVAAVVGAALAVGLIAVLPNVLDAAGLGDAARVALNVLRWPLLAVGFGVALALLYRFGPDRDDPRVQWVSWGAGVATVLWLVGSALFAVYTERFSSINETYGTLAGVIVLMLWLQLTAAVVLLGAELNAELERQTMRDSTVERPAPLGRRGAEAADTVGATSEQAKAERQQ